MEQINQIVNQLAVSQVSQVQTLKHLETGQTNLVMTVQTAMQSKSIQDATDKEIAQELNKIFFLIGLRNQFIPNQDQAKLIVAYIRNNYEKRKLDELFLAFDFYIKSYYCEDVKFYDQFSLQSLNSIMNGYRKYINELNSKLREVPPPETFIPKTDIQQDIEEYLNRTDLSRRNLVLIPTFIYENMLKLGYINQTEKRKVFLYRLATDMFESKLAYEAKDFDKFAIGKLNRFRKEKTYYFENIDDITVADIKQLYQKLSVLDEIQKHQRSKNKVSSIA